MVNEASEQLQLFDEVEAIREESPKPEEIKIPAHSRKRGGRKPLPEDLPRIEQIHDIREI